MSLRRVVALYRRASFSPNQHRTNDRAILDAVTSHFESATWRVVRLDEQEVERGRLPTGDLYLNMCQGLTASERLEALEADGALMVNRPSSVLNCHRRRMVRLLAEREVPFPHTLVLPTGGQGPARLALDELTGDGDTFWLKRGDVHAELPEDVRRLSAAELPAALHDFNARGIPWAALQRHIPGPVLKFYGLADRSFFRYYGAHSGPGAPPPAVDEAALLEVAYRAAEGLGLSVFGGDVALPAPDQPVLIDINDWPSFAPFRLAAGEAIARFAMRQASLRSVR